MNKEAPRTDDEIVRRGRGVLLNRQERQTQHRNWSAPDQIHRPPPETALTSPRIRLNHEPDARKSYLEPMNNDPSGKSQLRMMNNLNLTTKKRTQRLP